MFRNWFIISLIALMGLIGTLQVVSGGPMASTPIVLDGGDAGDGDDNDPGPDL